MQLYRLYADIVDSEKFDSPLLEIYSQFYDDLVNMKALLEKDGNFLNITIDHAGILEIRDKYKPEKVPKHIRKPVRVNHGSKLRGEEKKLRKGRTGFQGVFEKIISDDPDAFPLKPQHDENFIR